MRKMIMLFGALMVLLTACSTANVGTKAQRRQEMAAQVKEALKNRQFSVAVRMMTPLRGTTRQLEYGYGITLSGDTLHSYLPFFGRARNIPFNGGKGLNFDAVVKKCTVERTGKEKTTVTMTVFNGEESFVYTLDVFDNAQASLSVLAQERDQISYSGEMEFKKERKK